MMEKEQIEKYFMMFLRNTMVINVLKMNHYLQNFIRMSLGYQKMFVKIILMQEK